MRSCRRTCAFWGWCHRRHCRRPGTERQALSTVIIRPAAPSDATLLAALLTAYLTEQFPGHTGTSAEQLEHDVLSGASGQRVLLGEDGGHAVGFISWHRVYDLHWGK